MPAIPTNAKKFLLNTDYPMDKVVATFSGSFSALARFAAFSPRRTTRPISHDLGDWGLIVGAYSLDNSVWYPFGVTPADVSGSQPSFQTVECNARCNATSVDVIASNYTDSNRTVYYALQVVAKG